MRLFDYHTQTINHGLNQPLLVEETVQTAIEKRLQAICLTDHYPLPPTMPDPTTEQDCSMPRQLYFGDYQTKVLTTINKYADHIEVLKGAEFDWYVSEKTWTAKEIKTRLYDYVIGSVHFIPGLNDEYLILDYAEETFHQNTQKLGGLRNVIETYYTQIALLSRSKLFDGVGHFDLIKKYNDGSLFDENEDWYKKAALQALQVSAKSGIVIEINTNGLRKKCQAMYPSLWILEEALKLDIPVTLGSDGHQPAEVGRDLDQAIALAQQAGYKSIVRFRDRKIIQENL